MEVLNYLEWAYNTVLMFGIGLGMGISGVVTLAFNYRTARPVLWVLAFCINAALIVYYLIRLHDIFKTLSPLFN